MTPDDSPDGQGCDNDLYLLPATGFSYRFLPIAKFHCEDSSFEYHNCRTLQDDHLLKVLFGLCCDHPFKMRMLQPVTTMDEDNGDGIPSSFRGVNDRAWLRVISNSSHALHIQST